MRSLFPLQVEPEDIPQVRGLNYLPEYISHSEEQHFVAQIDAGAWDTSWQRRRQSFGETYGKRPAVSRELPSWAIPLIERFQHDGLSERLFDQLLINEYMPGQGIAPHCDYAPFDRTVASLSLLSACVMDFRQTATDRRHALLLEPRSLLVLSDDARYDWTHGIARRQTDCWHNIRFPRERRLSATFRLRKREGLASARRS